MKEKSTKDSVPAIIRTLDVWGAGMKPLRSGEEWEGDCPICGKEHHLFANPAKETWHCKVCGRGGNRVNLLTEVHARALKRTTDEDLERLAAHRAIPAEVLKAHRTAWHRQSKRWLVPGMTSKGTMHDLRRYDPVKKVMMSTAGCNSQLMGADLLAKAREGTRVWLCEGEWDGMAQRWLLDSAKVRQDIVVAVPGAGVLKTEWAHLFQGKDVIACYDADSAGDQGAEKAMKLLGPSCRSLQFIRWPESRPKGWDIRDHVTRGMREGTAKETLSALLSLAGKAPRTQPAGGAGAGDADQGLEPIGWEELIKAFEGVMLLTPDLRRALLVSLATCFSCDVSGDPLWMYVVGPPGAGKTLILTALAGSSRCVLRSTVTPHSLVSGWRGDGATDPSLIPKLKGATLVVKDFTEILSMPSIAQDEIFSTLRGAYDGMVQKSFGNGVMREYLDCRFAVLAGVTNAIHGSSTASLGERFLKVQLSKIEGAAADAVIQAAMDSVGKEREAEDTLKTAAARFLARKMDAASLPRMPAEYARRLTALVQLIAMLRAQVDRDKFSQDMLYRPTPEAGTRLAKQLVKLGMSVAHALEKPEVDAEVYRVVERVAFDTAYGWSLDIIDALMRAGGADTRSGVAERAGVPASTLSRRFDDLQALGAIAPDGKKVDGGRPATIYKVQPAVRELWSLSKGEKPCRSQPQQPHPARVKISRRSRRPSSSSSTTSAP